MVHAAAPPVHEGAHLAGVAPDDLVVAVGEERRVEVNEVNGRGVEGFEDFEVIAEEELVHGVFVLCVLVSADFIRRPITAADKVRRYNVARIYARWVWKVTMQ